MMIILVALILVNSLTSQFQSEVRWYLAQCSGSLPGFGITEMLALSISAGTLWLSVMALKASRK